MSVTYEAVQAASKQCVIEAGFDSELQWWSSTSVFEKVSTHVTLLRIQPSACVKIKQYAECKEK